MSGPIYYDNVFEAVSKDPMEVLDLTLRADLLDTVLGIVRERELTAKQVGRLLDIPPPRVSELMKGRLALLTVPKLIGYLGMLGYRLKPALAPGEGVICSVEEYDPKAA